MDKNQLKPPYYHDDSFIHFLNGEYELIFERCKKDNNYLGWSSSEKGDMIPLFVALLAKNNPVKPCSADFIKSKFHAYDEFDDFIKILPLSFLELSDEDHKKYMDYCLSEAEKRAEAILRGQHRRSYNKAAAFVVSLAEAICSNEGEKKAEEYIKSYKAKYPRHTAFHGELRVKITLAKLKMSL